MRLASKGCEWWWIFIGRVITIIGSRLLQHHSHPRGCGLDIGNHPRCFSNSELSGERRLNCQFNIDLFADVHPWTQPEVHTIGAVNELLELHCCYPLPNFTSAIGLPLWSNGTKQVIVGTYINVVGKCLTPSATGRHCCVLSPTTTAIDQYWTHDERGRTWKRWQGDPFEASSVERRILLVLNSKISNWLSLVMLWGSIQADWATARGCLKVAANSDWLGDETTCRCFYIRRRRLNRKHQVSPETLVPSSSTLHGNYSRKYRDSNSNAAEWESRMG